MYLCIFIVLFYIVTPCRGFCNVIATLSRTVKNEGFHRELVYEVELYALDLNDSTVHECSLHTREDIPSSFYVDPNQLADLYRIGKVTADVVHNVDIETPESKSSPHTVFIHSRLIPSSPHHLKSSFYIPIHVRYHDPKEGGGYRRAFLNSPKLFINCSRAINCGDDWTSRLLPLKPQCVFDKLEVKFNEKQYIDIPVGDLRHNFFISLFTFIVTSFGCFYILKILYAGISDGGQSDKK